MAVYLDMSCSVHEEDLKESIVESLSDEELKLFIMGLDLDRADLHFTLELLDDILANLEESGLDDIEKTCVDDARSSLEKIGWS